MASDIPVYGLDAELAAKAAAKYDPQMEAQVLPTRLLSPIPMMQARQWIESVTGKTLGGDFQAALKDGVLLCDLVNGIKPGTIRKINKMKMPFMQMENINAFLDAARGFGVKASDLFMTVDLYEAKNMGAVVQTIHALGGLVQKMPGYNGPVLGVRVSDKNVRHFDEQTIAEGKAAVPLLTKAAGKEQTSAGVSYGKRRDIGGFDPNK